MNQETEREIAFCSSIRPSLPFSAAFAAAMPSSAHVLVLAGPCGAGKTTLGTSVAAALGGAPFIDADDHHTRAALAAIAAGTALDDAYRGAWLERVAQGVREAATASASSSAVVVVACSALARRHRAALRAALDASRVAFAVLAPPAATLRARLEARTGHVATVALLRSQLATLQLPDSDEPDAAVFGGDGVTADQIVRWWGERVESKREKNSK